MQPKPCKDKIVELICQSHQYWRKGLMAQKGLRGVYQGLIGCAWLCHFSVVSRLMHSYGEPKSSISSRRLIQTITSNVGAFGRTSNHMTATGSFTSLWGWLLCVADHFCSTEPAESPSSWTWTRQVGRSGGWNFEHPSLWIHFPTSLPKAWNSDSIDCEHAGTAVAWKLAWLYLLLICFVSLSCILFFKIFQSWKSDLFSRITAHVCVFHAYAKHVFVFPWANITRGSIAS